MPCAPWRRLAYRGLILLGQGGVEGVASSLTKQCIRCKKIKKLSQFAMNKSLEKERDAWCNSCRQKYVKDLDSLKVYLRENNRVFNEQLWDLVTQIAEKKVNENQYDNIKEKEEDFERRRIKLYFSKMNLRGNDVFIDENADDESVEIEESQIEQIQKEDEIPQELIDRWGEGYTLKEYKILENKYREIEMQYALETGIHKDIARKLCKISLEMDKSLQEGNINAFKKLQEAYSNLMGDGKLKPVQMDLSSITGGLNTISEWVRKIEENEPIPEYIPDKEDDVERTAKWFIEHMKKVLGVG